MFKFLKKNAFILFLILSILGGFLVNDNLFVAAEENDVHLVLDTKNITNLPHNFRTTSNLDNLENIPNLNLKGLDTLNSSGSQQFSPENLSLMVNEIKSNLPITIVDLRQESHGFINEYPVSWKNEKNNANAGLSRKEVIHNEINKLNNIPIGVPLKFFNHPELNVVPKEVFSENQLVKSNSMSYVRIPVTDGKLPTDDMVDYFIEYINSMPKNTWLHFHCKQGIGRTTTFMIMYDIAKNYKNATLDEIIQRQLALSGLKEHSIASFPTKERLDFFTNFYNYIQEQDGNFKTTWSDWLKKNNTPITFNEVNKLNICA